jgi:hypothetical protein
MTMTQTEAKKRGYCAHCASYSNDRWNCQVLKPEPKDDLCILSDKVAERFKAERGLEGETQRHEQGNFGDSSLMKGYRGKKIESRYRGE